MSDNWLNSTRIGSGGFNTATAAMDSGILRKIKQPSNPVEKSIDDLLIFGYACKIFRDDEKARYIDQGKHLIPWMGDNSLKIDRYDVRGALTDLSHYEPPTGGYENRFDYLTPAEQKAEQLCEQERYYSLYHNDVEEEIYQEEELKRLKNQVGGENYAQVAFNYDAQPAETENSNENGNDEEIDEQPDEPYVPHPKFFIPADVDLPESVKLHAIIEKTAKFISDQGPQMEILIKAKQSNNPQFEFLNQSSRLNKFYKHTLQSMKQGSYPIGPPTPPPNVQSTDNGQHENAPFESAISSYFSSSSKTIMPIMKYKPSADCAYTQLISKIKGLPLPPDGDASNSPGSASQSNADFDYSAFYSSNTNTSSGTSTPVLPEPPTLLIDREKMAKTMKTIGKDGVEVKAMSTGLMLAQYYNSDSETENEDDEDESESNSATANQAKVDSPEKAPVQPTSTVIDESKLGIPYPPEELRNIIDKTAAYVLKNGKEFEDILRAKNDGRFTFLHYADQYNRYYVYKVTGVVCPPAIQQPPHSNANGCNQQTSKKSPVINEEDSQNSSQQLDASFAKFINPVSFSIKPKEEPTVPIRAALPQEASSDEEDGAKSNNKTDVTHSQIKIAMSSATNIPETAKTASITVHSSTSHQPESQFLSITKSKAANQSRNSTFEELNDSQIRDALFEPTNVHKHDEKKDTKRADDKVRDRLAQIAREKLGIISKEKQLQIERKKRAMAFLSNIKGETATESTTSSDPISSTPPATVEEPTKVDSDNGSSDESVTFINIIPSSTLPKNIRRPCADDDDSDDVIEVTPCNRKSKSRSRSRSRSSRSSKHKHKHRKKSKSKSKRSRSRSRSRSNRDDRSDSRRKRYHSSSSSKSKKRRRRSSSD